MASQRCLSIQSHVVHGYVGNKASTFPLQLHGFDVDPINSVQLSNHTAYRGFKGQVLDGPALESIVAGLRDNLLLGFYTHILTGYVGRDTFLRAIAHTVREVRKASPDAVYLCDPVLGDAGKLYVPVELVELYRQELLPLATILTPNQFEAEQLSGITITDEASALAACDVLHRAGAVAVVITSSESLSGAPPSSTGATTAQPTMLVVASCPADWVRDEAKSGRFLSRSPEAAGEEAPLPTPPGGAGSTSSSASGGSPGAGARMARFGIRIPKLDSVFTGTGDLTAALLLAHTHQCPGRFATAVERAIAAVQRVCTRTAAHRKACDELVAGAGKDSSSGSSCGRTQLLVEIAAASVGGKLGATVPAFIELQLVQSKRDLESSEVPEELLALPLLL